MWSFGICKRATQSCSTVLLIAVGINVVVLTAAYVGNQNAATNSRLSTAPGAATLCYDLAIETLSWLRGYDGEDTLLHDLTTSSGFDNAKGKAFAATAGTRVGR